MRAAKLRPSIHSFPGPGYKEDQSLKGWSSSPPPICLLPPLTPSPTQKNRSCAVLWRNWMKHVDARQWKSLQQQPKPLSLKVRTQRWRMPRGKSEMLIWIKPFHQLENHSIATEMKSYSRCDIYIFEYLHVYFLNYYSEPYKTFIGHVRAVAGFNLCLPVLLSSTWWEMLQPRS